MTLLSVSVVLLVTALAVAQGHLQKRPAKQHSRPPTPANAAIKTDAEKRVEHIFDVVKKVQKEVKQEEQTGGSNDKAQVLKRQQLRKRLLKELDGEVGTVLPEELKKLDNVFQSEEHPSGLRRGMHHLQHLSRGQRAAKKLANRKITRYEDPARCGAHIPATDLGIRSGPEAAKIFRQPALLQVAGDGDEEEAPVVSLARPGVGSKQTLADNGLSKVGKVGKDEPFVTVYKDGFFSVGCFKDLMIEVGDKFGISGKPKYDKSYSNVSVALYSALVLEEKQEPMSPRVCFNFCRTLEGMVYFGLQGSECYCTPFYEPTITDVKTSDLCDYVCPGDEFSLCGGAKKSSIFEMHTCGDKGKQLIEESQTSGQILSTFYAAALYAGEAGINLQASGELLEEVASLGGDPDSAEYAREAKKWAGELEQSFIKKNCLDEYNNLLMAYEQAETMAFSDLRDSKNLQAADDAATAMQTTGPKVKECTKAVSKAATMGYYPFEDSVDCLSDRDMVKLEEKYGTATVVFSPVLFAIASDKEPMMSTCVGEAINPMVGSFAECSEACDQMIHPEACLGFQFYHMGGHEDVGGSKELMRPLCFLYKTIKKVISYECPFTETLVKEFKDDLKAADEKEEKDEKLLFLQKGAVRGRAQKAEEPEEEEEEIKVTKIEEPHCGSIRSFLLYTGLTCDQLFGAGSSVKDTCPKECARSNAAALSATCFVKLSEVVPSMANPKIENKKRCFAGARNKEASSPEGADPYFLPFDEQGVVLSGDAVVGTSTVLEPIIWTVSESEE